MEQSKEQSSAGAEALDFLAGEWATESRRLDAGGGPDARSTGTARYRWDLGGRWLLYDFSTELPGLGAYAVHGGLGYDENAAEYAAFAVNSMGLLMAYAGRWEDETLRFCLRHPTRQDATQVAYRKNEDGTVTMTSARPGKDGRPEIYFASRMSRAG